MSATASAGSMPASSTCAQEGQVYGVWGVQALQPFQGGLGYGLSLCQLRSLQAGVERGKQLLALGLGAVRLAHPKRCRALGGRLYVPLVGLGFLFQGGVPVAGRDTPVRRPSAPAG